MRTCRRPELALAIVLIAACGEPTGGDEMPTSSGADTEMDSSSSGGGDAPLPTTSTIEDSGSGSDGPSASTTDTSGNDGPSDSTGPVGCGDGICALDEDADSCCVDCGVCDEGAVVRMETGHAGGAPGVGTTPGGMADTHAYFAGGSFAELVFPFTVTEEPVEGSAWFWAQQFFFDGTTQGGYTGVQATGIIGGEVVGKMMIFSIWDALGATPGPGAECEPFGGEGVGYSCRLAFDWRENVTYTMRLYESSEDAWSLAVHDPSRGQELLLGTIEVEPRWGRLRPPTAGFAEYYGQVDTCETVPHAVALLHMPIGDGTEPTSVNASVYGPCAARASSECIGPLCR